MIRTAAEALDAAARRKPEYADVRAVETRSRHVSTKNGKISGLASAESAGVGIRVLFDGSWGFAATDDLTPTGLEACAALAFDIAQASARARQTAAVLAPEDKYEADWQSPCAVDPFSVSVEANLELLLAIDAGLRREQGVTLAEASMDFVRERQVFASTLGSSIRQTRTWSGAGYTATSFREEEIQRRSYPNSFGGQFQLKGYELIGELNLLEAVPRVASEAVALHSAAQCPERRCDLILDSSQLALQIHESIGHPIELDRVLGSEANFAGMSFLTLDKLGEFKYGSDIVNVVADARAEHGPGLGTFAFDDEGVPAQRVAIITGGLFTGYLMSRETAARIGKPRSNGCMRADGWARVPIIRMTNISLLPGEQSIEEVFGGDGIYMETNKSWSIDDRRYNFQFGCEIGWELRGGKRVRMLKNPSYSGVSPEFWNSCAAIAGRDHWTLWGTPNCGKGQPEQVIGTGHGASPARFRNVRIGSAYSG